MPLQRCGPRSSGTGRWREPKTKHSSSLEVHTAVAGGCLGISSTRSNYNLAHGVVSNARSRLECRETRFNRAWPGGWRTTDSTFWQLECASVLVHEGIAAFFSLIRLRVFSVFRGPVTRINTNPVNSPRFSTPDSRRFDNPVARFRFWRNLRFNVAQSLRCKMFLRVGGRSRLCHYSRRLQPVIDPVQALNNKNRASLRTKIYL